MEAVASLGIQTHTDKVHKKLICDNFQKSYGSKAALKKHLKKHDEKGIDADPLLTDIAEACNNTPMILM